MIYCVLLDSYNCRSLFIFICQISSSIIHHGPFYHLLVLRSHPQHSTFTLSPVTSTIISVQRLCATTVGRSQFHVISLRGVVLDLSCRSPLFRHHHRCILNCYHHHRCISSPACIVNVIISVCVTCVLSTDGIRVRLESNSRRLE